jgi:hypothetical protein
MEEIKLSNEIQSKLHQLSMKTNLPVDQLIKSWIDAELKVYFPNNSSTVIPN